MKNFFTYFVVTFLAIWFLRMFMDWDFYMPWVNDREFRLTLIISLGFAVMRTIR